MIWNFRFCAPRKGLAGMIMEPVQGVGGIVVHTRGYAKKAAEIVRANGGLFILDEIQTGSCTLSIMKNKFIINIYIY